MRSKIKISLRFKFLICYLLLVVLTVGLLNTYGHKLMYQRLLDNAETSIYDEAEEIKSQYLANAYLVKSSITSIRKQLCAIHNATGIRIWISETDGKIIIDSDMQKNKEGYNINEYDSSLLSKQTVNSSTETNPSTAGPITASSRTLARLEVPCETAWVKASTSAFISYCHCR